MPTHSKCQPPYACPKCKAGYYAISSAVFCCKWKPPKLALLATFALLASSNADALTTYEFSIDGTQRHWVDAWECPGSICAPGTPGSIDGPPYVDAAWHSTLTVIAPDGDGTFGPDWSAVTYLFEGVRLFPYPISPTPTEPVLTFTVAGGVPSLNGTAVDGPDHYDFSGLGVIFDQPHEQHYGETFHRGVLTLADPFTTPVPEPGSWALLLAGIACLGMLQRTRRA